MRIRGRHCRTGEQIELTCADGKVTSVGPPTLEAIDAEAGWIAPGLFDIQVNGFNEMTEASQIAGVVEACLAHGVTSFLATITTDSKESLKRVFKRLALVLTEDPKLAARVNGFHLEGPAVSPIDGYRGSHPPEHVRPLTWLEFRKLQDAAEGRIRLVTLSPEHDGSMSLIKKLTAEGVVVAIGHTAATSEQIHAAAAAAGARLSTHLGSACPTVLPTLDNVLWAQLADDALWAGITADDSLPTDALRVFLRAKTPGRCVLAGNGDKFLDQCIAHAVTVGGATLADAIDMASVRPRELLGLPAHGIEVGSPVDFMLFDIEENQIKIRTVFVS